VSSSSGSVGRIGGACRPTAPRRRFTPTASLAASTAYTVSAKATDDSGNVMPSPFTWTFTTGKPRPAAVSVHGLGRTSPRRPSPTPVTRAAVELGTKVRFDAKGQVTGVRFYKSAANTGTHVGALYTSTGTLLESGTFTGETATGWQTLNFASPVERPTRNTTYVVAYFAPSGHYSAQPGLLRQQHGDVQTRCTPIGGRASTAGNGVYSYTSSSAFPVEHLQRQQLLGGRALAARLPNGDSTPPDGQQVTTPGQRLPPAAALSTTLTATMNEAVDL